MLGYNLIIKHFERSESIVEEQQLLMTIQLTDLNQSQRENELEDWFFFIRMMFSPSFFQTSRQTARIFEWTTFKKEAMQESQFAFGWLTVKNERNECRFHFDGQQLIIKNILEKNIFLQHESVIRDYIQLKMDKNGVFAYLRSYNEFKYHNIKEIEERLKFETQEAIDKLPKMRERSGAVVIDCNQLPGYDLSHEGLCFTSCWEMYYSSYYYRIIPKQVFLDVQQVEFVKEKQNGVICIQLYRDPFKWAEETNRHFQTYYRDQLGFDHLSWDNGVGLLKAPYIEYAYTDQSIQSVQYQNERMQPTQKKDATFFVTRSYNFVNDEYHEKRVRGRLNTQAYFPWVDEQRAQMMFYKVIDPRISLDDGIEAYCYYIKEYLEIAVDDEKYQEYLVTLRLYVPTENLTQLPLNEIREKLSDIQFKRIRKKRGRLSFDVKKGVNHLRVEIYDYPKLNKFATLQKI